MEITLRLATDSDRAFAREAHHKGYYETVIRQFGGWDEAAQDRFFEEDWHSAPHSVLICDGTPCGYVSVEENRAYTAVRELVVHPDYRGKGIGSTVLKGIIDSAHRRGVPVKLGVLHENNARFFYHKLGFAEYGRTEAHILMKI